MRLRFKLFHFHTAHNLEQILTFYFLKRAHCMFKRGPFYYEAAEGSPPPERFSKLLAISILIWRIALKKSTFSNYDIKRADSVVYRFLFQM